MSKKALHKGSRYRHARQTRRANRETRKLQTYLGRVIRDIHRKSSEPDVRLRELLEIATRIFQQKRDDKNKVYSVHAPEVECIGKGKAHKKYEFGCKASIVSTSRSNWILDARSLPGNPYDGHTLPGVIEKSRVMSGFKIKDAYVDRGYKGVKQSDVPGINVHIAGRRRSSLTRWERMWLKRRSAIEPIIGHLKSDNRLVRNYLRGRMGDSLNVILSACGYNFRKLLRAFFRLKYLVLFTVFRLKNTGKIVLGDYAAVSCWTPGFPPA